MRSTTFFAALLFNLFSSSLCGQSLGKQVSLHVVNQPLRVVLEHIGRHGGFYFSYNSNLVAGDSLVTLSVKNKPVKQVLDYIFNGSLQYREMQGFIILQRSGNSNYWYISGYVQDGISGERLNNVSIYEREHLAGTITDDNGYFRLQLKEKNNYNPVVSISVSRVSYEDTSFPVKSGYNQEVRVPILPSHNSLEAVTVSPNVQRFGLGRLLISQRLKKQSTNLRNFLASKPVQFSFTPGLGTHGQLGAEVVNKFSFNILGGYSAGVNGLEIGGLYNIAKADVRHVQIGGLFNIVGGSVHGVQVGGLYNKVFDSMSGLQVAGLLNRVKGKVSGLLISGLVSNVTGDVDGLMVSGLVGKTSKAIKGQAVSGLVTKVSGNAEGMILSGLISGVSGNMKGLQLSGITSLTRKTITGTQVSGIFNYTKHLKGLQIGLINYADTASGYSIGLININKKGYHRISLSGNDLADITFSYKAGNKQLYTILLASVNIFREKAYGAGYGLGNEWRIGKNTSLMSELVTMAFYNGSWNHVPIITSLRTSISVRVFKQIQIHAGPALLAGERKPTPGKGYAIMIPEKKLFSIGKTHGWVGWQVGIQL